MTKNDFKPLLIAFALVASATPSIAQGPPPGGRFPASPQFQAWNAWEVRHANVQKIGRTIRALGELEKDPTTQLSKPQAKVVLGILNGWRHKPVMTDDEAAKIDANIQSALNPKQRAAVTSTRYMRAGGSGGPGGRGGFGGTGGPGGLGGPGGMRAMPAPHDYNPLNPDTLPFERMRPRMTARLNDLTAKLQQAASEK